MVPEQWMWNGADYDAAFHMSFSCMGSGSGVVAASLRHEVQPHGCRVVRFMGKQSTDIMLNLFLMFVAQNRAGI